MLAFLSTYQANPRERFFKLRIRLFNNNIVPPGRILIVEKKNIGGCFGNFIGKGGLRSSNLLLKAMRKWG